MKLSISLADDDLAILDAYVESEQLGSRSAGVQRAISLLRRADLEQQYAEAFAAWHASGDAALWQAAAADGLTHEAW